AAGAVDRAGRGEARAARERHAAPARSPRGQPRGRSAPASDGAVGEGVERDGGGGGGGGGNGTREDGGEAGGREAQPKRARAHCAAEKRRTGDRQPATGNRQRAISDRP